MVNLAQGSPADQGQGRRVLGSAGTGRLPGWPHEDWRAYHSAEAQEPGRAPRSPAGASGPEPLVPTVSFPVGRGPVLSTPLLSTAVPGKATARAEELVSPLGQVAQVLAGP